MEPFSYLIHDKLRQIPIATMSSGGSDMQTVRIKELEAALKLAKDREMAALEIAKEALDQKSDVEQRNKWLEARINELEDPQGRRDSGLGWLSKVIQVINRVGRPMRSREIMTELRAMDPAFALDAMADADTYLSVVLRKGIMAGRLKRYKVAGTRGGYYALEKWIDKQGNLSDEMRNELL